MIKKKKDIINSLAKHKNDVGSTEIQIGLLTDKIAKLSEHFKNHSNNKDYDFYSVLINWNEKFLLSRIKHRVKKMLQNGWLDEVKNLMLNFEIDKIVPLDSLGYREIIKYHNEEINLQDLEDKIILKTKQFSKKQLKWFKSENINFTIKIDEYLESNEIANMIINKFQN